MNVKTMVCALALVGLGACASTSSQADKVADADAGRLPADDTGPVSEARQYAASAQDGKNRAALALEKANHEVQLASADDAAAKAADEQAKAQQKIADDSREPDALRQARMMREAADLHRRASDTRKDFASKLVTARQASLDTANRQVELANAKLELARVQALREAGVPAASKYDAAAFQARVNAAQRAHDDAAKKAHDAEAKAVAAHGQWENLNRQLQAKSVASPAQEGMGASGTTP